MMISVCLFGEPNDVNYYYYYLKEKYGNLLHYDDVTRFNSMYGQVVISLSVNNLCARDLEVNGFVAISIKFSIILSPYTIVYNKKINSREWSVNQQMLINSAQLSDYEELEQYEMRIKDYA